MKAFKNGDRVMTERGAPATVVNGFIAVIRPQYIGIQFDNGDIVYARRDTLRHIDEQPGSDARPAYAVDPEQSISALKAQLADLKAEIDEMKRAREPERITKRVHAELGGGGIAGTASSIVFIESNRPCATCKGPNGRTGLDVCSACAMEQALANVGKLEIKKVEITLDPNGFDAPSPVVAKVIAELSRNPKATVTVGGFTSEPDLPAPELDDIAGGVIGGRTDPARVELDEFHATVTWSDKPVAPQLLSAAGVQLSVPVAVHCSNPECGIESKHAELDPSGLCYECWGRGR